MTTLLVNIFIGIIPSHDFFKVVTFIFHKHAPRTSEVYSIPNYHLVGKLTFVLLIPVVQPNLANLVALFGMLTLVLKHEVFIYKHFIHIMLL